MIDGIRACEVENARRRELAAEIDRAMAQPVAEESSAAEASSAALGAALAFAATGEGDLLDFACFDPP